MSELHRHKINLSEGQKRKLRIAFKKRRSVVIGLTNDQISGVGGEQMMLTEQQHKAVTKAVKNKTGVRLMTSYDQLMKNKEGGLLKEMLEIVETKIPGGKTIISPLIRKKLAPMLKDRFLTWIKSLIDNELDTIIAKEPSGAGLKRCINQKLDMLIAKSKKRNQTDH